MAAVIWIIVSVLATSAATALILRLPARLTALLFLALPILVSPPWRLHTLDASIFTLVKMYSVAVGAAYILMLKFTGWAERPLGRILIWGLLAVNILEASVAELAEGGYVNGGAGLLLVMAQSSPRTIRVDRQAPRRDVCYPVSGLWVAGYTLWNFSFVYCRNSHGVIGAFAGLAVIHLLAPLVTMRGRSELYIQSRAIALALVVGLRIAAPHPPYLYLTPDWYVPAVGSVLSAVSLLLAGCLAWRSIARAMTRTAALLGPRTGRGAESMPGQ
jgi:hypothetical protein